jgi:hypothetical protein
MILPANLKFALTILIQIIRIQYFYQDIKMEIAKFYQKNKCRMPSSISSLQISKIFKKKIKILLQTSLKINLVKYTKAKTAKI